MHLECWENGDVWLAEGKGRKRRRFKIRHEDIESLTPDPGASLFERLHSSIGILELRLDGR